MESVLHKEKRVDFFVFDDVNRNVSDIYLFNDFVRLEHTEFEGYGYTHIL